MKIYNYSKEHRTLKAFFQRNRKPNEAPNKGDRYVPAMMLLDSVEGQYIDWRKKQEKEVTKKYKNVIDLLDSGEARIRIWNRPDQEEKNEWKH